MVLGPFGRQARRAVSLSLAATLLAAVPAYAEPAPVKAPRETTPTVSAPTTKTTPKTTTSTPVRKPADTSSAIDVPSDKETEAFRKELADRQKRLDEFNAQLAKLDDQLEIASEQYLEAQVRLAETKERVETANADLQATQQAYEVQTQILGTRAQSIYKDGSFATVEVLLDSKSVSDFLARVKFLNTIGMRDADIVASLNGQKGLLESQVADLKTAQDSAASLEFELRARKVEIELRIQERTQMLAEAQTDLLSLLDEEAARRQIEEQKLLAQILSGADAAGISVEPGSPVETALAYHGVPYLWGGETPAGLDCSGLVLYVFRQHGVELPHYSGSQFLMGEKVAPAAMQSGDVVFFGSPIHHVGIYMGGGYYIHAPRTGDFVKISKLADRSDFAGARRYPWTTRTAPPLNAVSTAGQALTGVNR